MDINNLCPVCGCDLEIWKETFHEEHYCPNDKELVVRRAVQLVQMFNGTPHYESLDPDIEKLTTGRENIYDN